jgi:nicotinate-nucleotide adenylyltransferase
VRLGLFGGTFDPPHYGHLVAAQEAACQLELSRVLFLPARQNPLKRGEEVSPAEDRCQMVSLAIEGNPVFELSRADLDRPSPSYTVDLLRALRAERPTAELFFLVGADILPELPRWHAPSALLELATLVAINRPGAPVPSLAALEQALPAAAERVVLLEIPGMGISATDLRARVRLGQPIRYLTPPAVEHYIYQHGLYQPRGGGAGGAAP